MFPTFKYIDKTHLNLLKSYQVINMKKVTAMYDNSQELYICGYGYEKNSEIARWGKGTRELYFLHYVLSGSGFFNGNIVKEGEGFYISPNLIHEYYSSKENPWTYFWVALNGEKAGEICKKHIAINENGIFEYPAKSALQNIIALIFENKDVIGHVKALGYFYLLLSLQDNQKCNAPNFYVENAKSYMRNNYSQNISVKEIADILSISDRYLYNLFVKYEKVSPKQYLNDLKIQRACWLLKTTNHTISEVALSVGYADIFAFSKFFSVKTGMSPSEYRRDAKAQYS